MARIPLGTLVRIDEKHHIIGQYFRSNGNDVGKIGKVVHISPDRFTLNVLTPAYVLQMVNGERIYWKDENDLTVVGLLTK